MLVNVAITQTENRYTLNLHAANYILYALVQYIYKVTIICIVIGENYSRGYTTDKETATGTNAKHKKSSDPNTTFTRAKVPGSTSM